MFRRTMLGAGLVLFTASALAAEEHNVVLDDDFFSPQHLTITAGDSVRWTNQGNMPHNVVANDGSFRCAEGCDNPSGPEIYHEPGSGNSPGDPSTAAWSFSRTFNEPGQIGYFCEAHGAPGLGMFGTITVEPADDNGNGDSDFAINFGLTGSWFNPATGGQGFLFDVVLRDMEVVVYWFTYDQEAGGPDSQRWMVAQGPFEEGGDTVAMEVIQVTGGVFDDPEPVEPRVIGSAELVFHDCFNATMTYNLDFDGDATNVVAGTIPITRLSPDVMCEALAEENGN